MHCFLKFILLFETYTFVKLHSSRILLFLDTTAEVVETMQYVHVSFINPKSTM